MDISQIYKGKRVSVPKDVLNQGKPWEEPYGTVVGSFSAEGVSVRLDGECATIIRIHPQYINDE